MMKVARSSTLSNRKNCNSARSIPLAGSFTSFCANNRTEPATSPTNSPDEANFNSPNGNIQTALDAPAVLLPGGHVLLVGGNTVREVNNGQTQFWSNPSTVMIFDPVANTIAAMTSQPPSNGVDGWQARFLLL